MNLDPKVLNETTAEQAAAAQRAIDSLETYVRLDEFELRGDVLTASQERDRTAALEAWREAANILPGLPVVMDSHWTREQLDSAIRTLKGVRTARGWQKARETYPIMDYSERGSGNPYGAAHGDQLREMYESRTFQRDFDLVKGFEETRSIANFSDAGALYTSDFASLFAMALRTESPWFRLATVVRADNGRPLNVPTLTADGTAYQPGEGTAITESSPTLGSATITPVSYKALTLVSWESFEDTEYPLMQKIAQSQARTIALKFGTAATADALSGLNNGGTATGAGGSGTAATTFFGYEDLIDLKYSRAEPYRESASWVMANGAIKKVAKFKDQQGNYFWQPSPTGLLVPLLGALAFEDPYLAAPASATKSVIYGDIGRACFIKATELRVAISTEYKFDTDQVAIKSVLRADLAVVDATAAAYLVSGSA